jgi:hypothetical protein
MNNRIARILSSSSVCRAARASAIRAITFLRGHSNAGGIHHRQIAARQPVPFGAVNP